MLSTGIDFSSNPRASIPSGRLGNDPNNLNTPRLVADQAQQTVWKWDQAEPFGVNVPDENPSALGAFEMPLRFPGQYSDKETNLNYNIYRDFDSTIGRYVQSDLVGLQGGLNTYRFVYNAPLHYVDLTGLEACTTLGEFTMPGPTKMVRQSPKTMSPWELTDMKTDLTASRLLRPRRL